MTTEQILLSAGLLAVGLIIGFLLTLLLGRKNQSALNQQLTESQVETKQAGESLTELKTIYQGVANQLRTVELEHESLKANLQSETARKSELDKELKEERTLVTQLKDEKATLGEQAKGFEVSAKEIQQNLDEAKATIASRETKHEGLQGRFDTLNNDYTELKTTLEERDVSHAKQLETFDEQKRTLQKVFENSANKIFDEKNRVFSESNKTNIDSLLKPFRDQIEGFQTRINTIHDESLKGNTSLNSEIKKVLDIGLKMSDEASNLTSALKGDSQKRGA